MMMGEQIEKDDVAGLKRLPGSLHVVAILARRELRARLVSIWLYVVASAACLLAAVFGGGFLDAFRTETVLVSADPLVTLNTSVLALVALVLGLRLSASLSWEREHRTLEVLLVGPVRLGTVVLAKFATELAVLLLVLVIYWSYLLVGQPMGRGVIGFSDTAGLWSSAVYSLPLLATGLLVSSLFSSVRASVVFYLIVVVCLVLFETITLWLRVLPPQDLSLSVLYLRTGIESTYAVLRVVSPISYMVDLFTSFSGLSVLSVGRSAMAVGVTVLILVLTLWIGRRKGSQ